MPKNADSVTSFFANYPSDVSKLAASLRKVVRAAIPEASETLDVARRVVGYAVGEGYSGLVCTIIPSKAGVKLGVGWMRSVAALFLKRGIRLLQASA